MEWKEYKLGDVCSISSSKRIFASEYKNAGIPFYRGKEIIEKQKGNNISNELFISHNRYIEIKEKFGVPQEGDLLLTSVGTLGIPYVVKNEEFYFKDGNLTWFKNFKGLNSLYLYYWFLSPDGRHEIDSKAIGSTQKALTIDALSKFCINLPNLNAQKQIINILSSLDAKIENNNKINANLETQAAALFKSWFVDFEPFRDGEFVESELGMIPKGWKVGTLSDLIEVKYGKDHKKLKDGIIPVYGSGGFMRSVEKQLYEGESVLIPRKGTLNNVMYVNEAFWTVDTMFYSVMKVPNAAIFVYQYLITKDLASMNAGSAVPSMTADILNKMVIIVPPQELLCQFDSIVQVLYKTKASLKNENQRLSSLRDTLLPKLMSGEIDLDNIKL